MAKTSNNIEHACIAIMNESIKETKNQTKENIFNIETIIE
jgi:hypothetical protein